MTRRNRRIKPVRRLQIEEEEAVGEVQGDEVEEVEDSEVEEEEEDESL
jgi:hypothetical protein